MCEQSIKKKKKKKKMYSKGHQVHVRVEYLY